MGKVRRPSANEARPICFFLLGEDDGLGLAVAVEVGELDGHAADEPGERLAGAEAPFGALPVDEETGRWPGR